MCVHVCVGEGITVKYQLKYCSKCTMGSIAQGRSQEANIAQGEVKYYICLGIMPTCNISCNA